MYDAIIEINDVDLPLLHSGTLHKTPAFALLQQDGLSFGVTAQAQARLHPLKVNNRFIAQLSMVETPELAPYARHHADLAYRFLQHAYEQSGSPARCVFAVPSTYTAEQLSVLLGVVRQCPFDAVGLVDQCAAAASVSATQATGVYCDLQLHQLLVTEYACIDGEVISGEGSSLNQMGLLALMERWVRIIAGAFIQQCRFDPLHDASIEQQLWADLPQQLADQFDSDVFQFNLLNKHLVRIPRAEMLQPVAELYAQIERRIQQLSPNASEYLMSTRLAGLPGLLAMDSRMLKVPEQAIFKGIEQQQLKICTNTDNLPLIKRLSANIDLGGGSAAAVPTVAPAQSSVTHFVLDNVARPLRGLPLCLNASGQDIAWAQEVTVEASACVRVDPAGQCTLERLDSSPLWLNGLPFSEALIALNKGDRLRLTEQGAELAFIEVLSDA